MKRITLNKKSIILFFRGVIFFILFFFGLYNPGNETSSLTPFMLIAVYFVSNLVLILIPEKKLQKPGYQTGIFLFDTAIISLVLYASEGWNSDLYLIYFLIVFMSGMQMKIWQSFLVGTVASVFYAVLLSGVSLQEGILNTHFLLRFPFFYIISFFTGYFVWEVREKEQQIEEAGKQLIQSEKLAAIGQLTAGIVHELNNPLAGIMGFTRMSIENLKNTELPPQIIEDLETILRESQRCHNIVQDLLKFSRKEELQKKPVSLCSLLELVLRLVRYDFLKADINIICECSDSLPLLLADSPRLWQVFLNIVTNARQSMEKNEKGTLIIRAWQETDKILISFKDNGCGIPEKHLNRIFEPFFTTKPTGQGTGLGLAISYEIIKQHNGFIRVESREGEGSTFIVKLPACQTACANPRIK